MEMRPGAPDSDRVKKDGRQILGKNLEGGVSRLHQKEG